MRHVVRIRILSVVLAFVAVLGAAPPASAQYFGRNKVQYKDFQFEVLKTQHFEIYFYPQEREAAGDVARMAERWYARLSKIFNYDLSSPQPLVLYASGPDFRQTNVISGEIGEGTGGVTEGAKRRIVMPLGSTLADTDHVLGHELVHAFQYDIARHPAGEEGQSIGSSLGRLPLWFIEGMAEYLSIGHVDPHTAMWIRDAAREEGRLPEIKQLGDPRLFPYRWGQALWAYVAGRWGDAVVARAFSEALALGSASEALEKVTGLSAKDLSKEWHEAIRAQHGPILKAAKRATASGRSLTADQKRRGALAVSPALSPDGTRVAYLAERDMLSIDLFLADAATGRVVRKLVNTAIDPHFSSIQFISSAGTWHRNGRQFAFGAIRNGDPVLAIIDVEKAERVREVPFPDLGEILNPSWSPDGRSIAFSATAGGRSDLFVYDLETQALRRLTTDAFADLQPAWSPDGRRLAFVTDRFSTDLSRLRAGALGLAIMDVSSGSITALPTFETGKSINPQWTPDGERLYFLSDRSGITNVYSMDVASGRVSRLTDLDSGASGITSLSPALSASLDANIVAFSGYEEGRIGIYLLEGREVLSGGVPLSRTAHQAEPSAGSLPAATLPPLDRTSSEVSALLRDATLGLPSETGEVEPYRSRLSLDGIGQPYVAAGVDRFGGTYGGGIAFSLSDTLGNHNLFAAVDVNTYGRSFSDIYKDTGALVAYQNLTHRWNWGLSGGQVPYVAGGFASGLAMVDDELALVEQGVIQRQTYRGVNGATAYPFSEVRRIEFGAGYQQVTFDRQVRTIVTSVDTGRRLRDERENFELADALHLGSASVAAVHDTSVFGATSPVAGQRSRFEVAPTFGSLSFAGVLADYRRYFMPKRFYTIAGRVLHYGRYGAGGEDERLLPLYLGYPEFIRGYGVGSFNSSECAEGPAGSCEVFDRLLGSRMLVGNLEFRFPLLRPFGVREKMYGPVPVEVGAFVDAGVAWTRDNRPAFLGGDRRPVSSAGVTFRINMFGFAVAQIDYARPFQRPGRGWVWGFSLTPGF